MQKKSRPAAPNGAKPRKRATKPKPRAMRMRNPTKSTPVLADKALSKTGLSRASVAAAPLPADPKLKIRRLKAQLAAALAQIEQLRASADTDFLLEILNRRGFERELHRSAAYIRRYRATGALIVLDVDRLKPINDSFGHAAGDQVLKAVVEVLLRHVRASDLVGRLGGDEFVMLLWNLSEADAQAKAAALETAIDGLRFAFAGQSVAAGASAGLAMLGPGDDVAQAMQQADRAMYVRKAERRASASPGADAHEPATR
jgi:diguanylate cyclase (GGDEF)-like protein